MADKVFLKVIGNVFENENFLIGFAHFEPVTKGWVVREKTATNFEGENGFYEAAKVALHSRKSLSGYKDGDVELWDVVQIYDTEEEATKAGKKNGQMSIYQIETGRLKWIW